MVNYIKRLVGLPGETVVIRHGDIFVLDPQTAGEPAERQRFRIARKPPEKVVGMLQLVDDTRYIGPKLRDVGWPSRWVFASDGGDENPWTNDATGAEFAVQAGDRDTWLRYRHMIPRPFDWRDMNSGRPPDLSGYRGMLITDYYAYNDAHGIADYGTTEATNWVGDLALECAVEVTSDAGELMLDLVEGGVHFTCRFDIATGRATLVIGNSAVRFRDDAGAEAASPEAMTSLRGKGTYRLRFANVDDQLFLWVNDKVVEFNGPTTFDSRSDVAPRWSPEDDGDFRPLGVGARQASFRISELKVLRDVYYMAVSVKEGDYWHADYSSQFEREDIYDALSDPRTWATTQLFASRRSVTFEIGPDQYFPLGDNSPQSKDARLWSFFVGGQLDPPPAVDRRLMIGKALFIYWPHAWYLPALPVWPVIPNYQRIGFIR
jgi:signal peptidase I